MTPKPKVRVIALGSPHGGDDEVALTIAQRLADAPGPELELIIAGRPGAGLVDLLDTPTPVLLLDVVRSGRAAGSVIELSLAQLRDHAIAGQPISSHGFGPSEALRLAAALGRSVPPGRFVGIEGEQFEIGAAPSGSVSAAMDRFEAQARAAALALADPKTPNREATCTSPD